MITLSGDLQWELELERDYKNTKAHLYFWTGRNLISIKRKKIKISIKKYNTLIALWKKEDNYITKASNCKADFNEIIEKIIKRKEICLKRKKKLRN